MKFVVDGMLGKLARWLRLLGHDTKYSNSMEDRQLLAVAKKEKRILLTRDLQLYQRATAKGLDTFYVEGQTQVEKLAHMAKRFGIKLDIDMTESRCLRCNATVKSVQKEEIRKSVEENTFSSYKDFWICPKCKQAYWQGAHWPKIGKMLDTANRLLHDGKPVPALSKPKN